MLALLVKEKMSTEKLSLRSAAKQIGTSHTTISRLLEGTQIDFATLERVCFWLGIPTSEILKTDFDIKKDEEEVLSRSVLMLIRANPELKLAFKRLIEKYQIEKIDKQIVDEIISFMIFKLGKKFFD